MDDLRGHLTAALKQAMRGRDTAAVAALRSALAAIANSEAVDVAAAERGEHPLGREGIGAAEVPRRELTAAAVVAVVRQEVRERETAAADYDRLGRADDAARLLHEAATLREFVDSSDDDPFEGPTAHG